MLLGTLSLLFPILASGATTTDVAAGAESRINAGLIPINGKSEVKPGTELTLLLSAGVLSRSRRSSLELIYRPRFYIQYPNYIDSTRPLILHRLLAGYDRSLSKRTRFGLTAQGEIGEISYSNLEQIFEPGTGAVQLRIIPLLVTSSTLSLDHQLTPRSGVGISWSGGYRTTLSADDQGEGEDLRAFPTSYNASLALNYGYRVDPTSTLSVNVRGGYLASTIPPVGFEADFPSDDALSQTIAGGGGASWQKRLSASDTLGITLGGAVTYLIELDVFDFVPTANFNHSTQWGNRAVRWTSKSSGGLRGFLDRVNATYGAQIFASWDVIGQFGPDWSSGARFFASTSLQSSIDNASMYGDYLRLSLPTNFSINQVSSISFGVHASLRAPAIREAEGLPLQPDIVGFFNYQVNEGTDSSRGAWAR